MAFYTVFSLYFGSNCNFLVVLDLNYFVSACMKRALLNTMYKSSSYDFFSLPLQIGLALYLLYTQVKFAFLSGLAITILLIPGIS